MHRHTTSTLDSGGRRSEIRAVHARRGSTGSKVWTQVLGTGLQKPRPPMLQQELRKARAASQQAEQQRADPAAQVRLQWWPLPHSVQARLQVIQECLVIVL